MDYRPAIYAYFSQLKHTIDLIDVDELQKACDCLLKARDEKRFVYTMGNGGSAATASHWAGDFNKGMSLGRNKRYRFIALNDNQPTMLSLANDVSYEAVFWFWEFGEYRESLHLWKSAWGNHCCAYGV